METSTIGSNISPHVMKTLTHDKHWYDLELEIFGNCLDREIQVMEAFKLANAFSMEFDKKEYDIRRVKLIVQKHDTGKKLVSEVIGPWKGYREFTIATFAKILNAIGNSKAADIVMACAK